MGNCKGCLLCSIRENNRNDDKCENCVKELAKKVLFCLKTVCFMEVFNFEQRKRGELQEFIDLKEKMVEWRYGRYVVKNVVCL